MSHVRKEELYTSKICISLDLFCQRTHIRSYLPIVYSVFITSSALIFQFYILLPTFELDVTKLLVHTIIGKQFGMVS